MKKQIVLITGGGTGIGEACSRLYAENGATVVIMGRRKAPLEKLVADIGGLAISGDASLEVDCRTAVETIREQFGRLDVLVSSAGIMREGSVTDMTNDAWNHTMDANLNSIMQISRHCIPLMIENGGGNIVNIASLGAMVAPGNMAAYITSKTAIIGLTRSLAVDYGSHNIRANTLLPGWVLTPMSQEEMARYAHEEKITTEEAITRATRFLPLQRMAEPLEIAKCVQFLASDASSFVTGTTLVADGGSSAVDVGYISL